MMLFLLTSCQTTEQAAPTEQPIVKATAVSTPTAPPKTAEPPADITTNLAAWYAFDGDANDGSGNQNHATIFGATFVEDRDGNNNSAIQFDGVDDYLQVDHTNRSLDLNFTATISLWFYHQPQEDGRTFYTLLEKGDPDRGGHSRYGLWLIDNHVEFCIQPNSGSFHFCLDSVQPLEAEQWHHIVGVHTGEALEIYIDGELDNSSTHGRVGISTSPFELFIGTDLYAPTPVYTNGTLDDVRIYRRPLTSDEIQQLYQN